VKVFRNVFNLAIVRFLDEYSSDNSTGTSPSAGASSVHGGKHLKDVQQLLHQVVLCIEEELGTFKALASEVSLNKSGDVKQGSPARLGAKIAKRTIDPALLQARFASSFTALVLPPLVTAFIYRSGLANNFFFMPFARRLLSIYSKIMGGRLLGSGPSAATLSSSPVLKALDLWLNKVMRWVPLFACKAVDMLFKPPVPPVASLLSLRMQGAARLLKGVPDSAVSGKSASSAIWGAVASGLMNTSDWELRQRGVDPSAPAVSAAGAAADVCSTAAHVELAVQASAHAYDALAKFYATMRVLADAEDLESLFTFEGERTNELVRDLLDGKYRHMLCMDVRDVVGEQQMGEWGRADRLQRLLFSALLRSRGVDAAATASFDAFCFHNRPLEVKTFEGGKAAAHEVVLECWLLAFVCRSASVLAIFSASNRPAVALLGDLAVLLDKTTALMCAGLRPVVAGALGIDGRIGMELRTAVKQTIGRAIVASLALTTSGGGGSSTFQHQDLLFSEYTAGHLDYSSRATAVHAATAGAASASGVDAVAKRDVDSDVTSLLIFLLSPASVKELQEARQQDLIRTHAISTAVTMVRDTIGFLSHSRELQSYFSRGLHSVSDSSDELTDYSVSLSSRIGHVASNRLPGGGMGAAVFEAVAELDAMVASQIENVTHTAGLGGTGADGPPKHTSEAVIRVVAVVYRVSTLLSVLEHVLACISSTALYGRLVAPYAGLGRVLAVLSALRAGPTGLSVPAPTAAVAAASGDESRMWHAVSRSLTVIYCLHGCPTDPTAVGSPLVRKGMVEQIPHILSVLRSEQPLCSALQSTHQRFVQDCASSGVCFLAHSVKVLEESCPVTSSNVNSPHEDFVLGFWLQVPSGVLTKSRKVGGAATLQSEIHLMSRLPETGEYSVSDLMLGTQLPEMQPRVTLAIAGGSASLVVDFTWSGGGGAVAAADAIKVRSSALPLDRWIHCAVHFTVERGPAATNVAAAAADGTAAGTTGVAGRSKRDDEACVSLFVDGAQEDSQRSPKHRLSPFQNLIIGKLPSNLMGPSLQSGSLQIADIYWTTGYKTKAQGGDTTTVRMAADAAQVRGFGFLSQPPSLVLQGMQTRFHALSRLLEILLAAAAGAMQNPAAPDAAALRTLLNNERSSLFDMCARLICCGDESLQVLTASEHSCYQ
jgi:hypothetical protein